MEDNFGILIGIAAVLFIVGAVVVWVASVSHIEHRTCTVSEKDRARNSDGGSDARVYTEECGVLKVADSYTQGHLNSADTYSQIKPGQKYDFKLQGYRIPIFSQFPNIVEATPVN
jgi:hypothetical protein